MYFYIKQLNNHPEILLVKREIYEKRCDFHNFVVNHITLLFICHYGKVQNKNTVYVGCRVEGTKDHTLIEIRTIFKFKKNKKNLNCII